MERTNRGEEEEKGRKEGRKVGGEEIKGIREDGI